MRSEAIDRARVVRVLDYDIALDLRGDSTFASRTAIDLASTGGETFLDLKASAVTSIRLDGAELGLDQWRDGRYPLSLSAGEHHIEVAATMPFRSDGEGMHRAVDPADGNTYLYQMSFMSAAPSVFACFDQPDLKAPVTLHVTAPLDWTVTANAAGAEVEPGRWEFERSAPLSTYFVSLVAGPYHRISSTHDGIPLGLLCRSSMAGALEADAGELFELTGQCFDRFHELFGIRYPFGKYDQAWVPDFNAGAMENPGCVTFRESLVFTSKVPRAMRIQRATTLAHEMAHQWFGNLVTPVWWDDLWLNEAFAEYMGNRVAAEATQFSEALVWASLTRKNWGLNADSRPSTHPVAGNGAVDADAALQDFDGISYSKGHAVLTQLAARLGDEVFFGGVRDHFEAHRFGNATMADLLGAWQRAGANDLGAWSQSWLQTAGLDRIAVDREQGTVTRTPPPVAPAGRDHLLSWVGWDGAERLAGSVEVNADAVPFSAPDGPLVLDADATAWADLAFDAVTARRLPAVMGGIDDPMIRATIWNTARNGVHQVRYAPGDAVDLLCAGIPEETQDAALSALGTWAADDGEGGRGTVHEKLLPLLADPDRARTRLHEAFTIRAATAPPGSELAFAALESAIRTAPDTSYLRGLLEGGLSAELAADPGIRWRVMRRLTTLGGCDLGDLDTELARKDDAKTQLNWAWCRARLQDPEAKEWAWRRFTGEEPATNYEIEAIGAGFWQTGAEELVAPYRDRYFAEIAGTAAIRTGWLLGSAAEFFFPITMQDATTLELARAAIEEASDPTLRRVLTDTADQLRRRIEARARWSG